jgi:hypothetical protein
MSEQTQQQPAAPVKAPVSYTLAGGQILRNNEPVANYDRDTGALDFLPAMDRFRAPVVKFLNENELPIAPQTPPAPEAEKRPATTPPPVPPAAVVEAPAGQVAPQAPALGKQAPVDPIKVKTYPGQPAINPMLGDKDPVFVEWLKANHPDDFRARYANRKTHLD